MRAAPPVYFWWMDIGSMSEEDVTTAHHLILLIPSVFRFDIMAFGDLGDLSQGGVSVICRLGVSLVEPSKVARLGRRRVFVSMTGEESFRCCHLSLDDPGAVSPSSELASS